MKSKLVLIIIVIALLLSGCSGKSDAPISSNDDSRSAAQTTNENTDQSNMEWYSKALSESPPLTLRQMAQYYRGYGITVTILSDAEKQNIWLDGQYRFRAAKFEDNGNLMAYLMEFDSDLEYDENNSPLNSYFSEYKLHYIPLQSTLLFAFADKDNDEYNTRLSDLFVQSSFNYRNSLMMRSQELFKKICAELADNDIIAYPCGNEQLNDSDLPTCAMAFLFDDPKENAVGVIYAIYDESYFSRYNLKIVQGLLAVDYSDKAIQPFTERLIECFMKDTLYSMYDYFSEFGENVVLIDDAGNKVHTREKGVPVKAAAILNDNDEIIADIFNFQSVVNFPEKENTTVLQRSNIVFVITERATSADVERLTEEFYGYEF